MRTLMRVLIGLAFWYIGRKDVRYSWLAHYLIGVGTSRWITDPELLKEASQEITWRYQDGGNDPAFGVQVKTSSRGKLYYLVGTWSAQLLTLEDGRTVIYGVDRYDWHQSRFVCPACGRWGYDIQDGVCSSCDSHAVPGWWWTPTSIPGRIAVILRHLWPGCREYVDVGRDGFLAVSNGFWPWIGGTEFDTVLEFEWNYPPKDDPEEEDYEVCSSDDSDWES